MYFPLFDFRTPLFHGQQHAVGPYVGFSQMHVQSVVFIALTSLGTGCACGPRPRHGCDCLSNFVLPGVSDYTYNMDLSNRCVPRA